MEKKSYVPDFQRKTTVGTQSLSFFPSAYESEEEKDFFYFFFSKGWRAALFRIPRKGTATQAHGSGQANCFPKFSFRIHFSHLPLSPWVSPPLLWRGLWRVWDGAHPTWQLELVAPASFVGWPNKPTCFLHYRSSYETRQQAQMSTQIDCPSV